MHWTSAHDTLSIETLSKNRQRRQVQSHYLETTLFPVPQQKAARSSMSNSRTIISKKIDRLNCPHSHGHPLWCRLYPAPATGCLSPMWLRPFSFASPSFNGFAFYICWDKNTISPCVNLIYNNPNIFTIVFSQIFHSFLKLSSETASLLGNIFSFAYIFMMVSILKDTFYHCVSIK